MRQRGYSLLLSLFVLLGLAGVWLSGFTLQRHANLENQTIELSLARASLISYAVSYIDHYGAQGAGIGHLPCPDTDEPKQTSVDPWHLDGPNPPCAKQLIERGWLPRRVNVRDGRYHFHTRQRQRLLYAVSGRFINNPTSRVVNPSTEGNISVGNFNDIVAVVAAPPLDHHQVSHTDWLSPGYLTNNRFAYSVIRASDIRVQAMQRVGAWLLKRLNDAQLQRCPESDFESNCGVARPVLSQCEFSNRFNLLQWLHVQTEVVDCQQYKQMISSVFTLFEDVPIERHWFIRNQWHRFVEVTVDDACKNRGDNACRFVLLATAGDERKLRVRLQPTVQVVHK